MGPFSMLDAGNWGGVSYNVEAVSNSTVTGFRFNPNNRTISFNVTGRGGVAGFCRVAIPRGLMWVDNQDEWTVIVGGTLTSRIIIEANNFTYIYFTYSHSTKKVEIQSTHAVPESFLTPIIALCVMSAFVLLILKKKRKPT